MPLHVDPTGMSASKDCEFRPQRDGLQIAEAFLNPLALPLAEGVTSVPGRPAIDRTAAGAKGVGARRQPEGNGCVERFFRTLKEQLLWIRPFRDLEKLRTALIEFRNRYNYQWILERLNYPTPVQARCDFTLELHAAA